MPGMGSKIQDFPDVLLRRRESSRVDEGAPNGSVPQNSCSSGKCLLAGSSKIIGSLEGKSCWEINNSGCLSGF